MSKRFMIGSLLAAGFGQNDALQASIAKAAATGPSPDKNLFQVFRQDHLYTLVGHASHSSHSSHASHSSGGGGHSSHFSHTSHYSSTGGYPAPAYSPAPAYAPPSPTPAPAPEPRSGSAGGQPFFDSGGTAPGSPLKPLPGRSSLFKQVVMRVQVALMGRGLYDGAIDGGVGPRLRASLRAFQAAQGLAVTGTITPETLDALHVPSS